MLRTREVHWLIIALFVLAPHVSAAEVLTNDSIITMVKAGFGEEVIISKIKVSQNQFDLSTQALVTLKAQGVSEAIIKTMVDASAPTPPVQPKRPQELAQDTQGAIALYHQGKIEQAALAFDRLLAETPTDDELKIWKALALLEQARARKEANASGYKPLVVQAYAILQPLGRSHVKDANWNFAMAKAYWLNDRPTWAKRAAGKAIELRPDFPEAQLLLGDLAYDDDVEALTLPAGNPRAEVAKRYVGQEPRKQYEKVLAISDLRPALRAEAFYKLGVVSAQLEKKITAAREYWERAAAANPECRYGVMAQQRLKAVSAK